MICAVSDKLKEKFLAKMVGDVLASARSGQPFSLENYIKDTYKQIFEKTGDRAKAQTFASFIPNNLVAIYSVNKEAVKHLRPAFAEFDMLRDTFEDFDAVGTYLGIGNEAAQQKREEIIANNEASLDIQEDETLGASPEVVLGTAVPTNKSAISAPFKAAGKSALTAFNVVPKENVDPIIQASQQFIAKYHQGQKTNDPAYSGLRIQIIDSRSFEGEIPGIERDFLEANPEYAGVKAIIVNAEGNPIKVDASGNIAEEGTTPQYVINKPSLVNDVFTVKGEAPISEVASSAGVDIETAQEARQKEYRTLYNIRQALQVNPNQKIYLDINTSAGASVTFDSSNPIKLSEIDFKSFGEEFIYEVDPATGRAYFTVSFSNKLIRIDRPGITDVIPAETLAKYLFDTSVPYQTKKEIFESLLFTKDIKIRETAILYKGQPITEEALAQVLKSVTESASGVVTSTYRANVPISSNGSVDIPYYDQNSLKYNTLSTTDYMLKYFNTTARLEETTKPYFNLSFDPALQLELQSATENSSKSVNSKVADVERRRQEEILNRKGNTISESEVKRRFIEKRNSDSVQTKLTEALNYTNGNVNSEKRWIDKEDAIFEELIAIGVKPDNRGVIDNTAINKAFSENESKIRKEVNDEIKQEGLKRVTDEFRKQDDTVKFKEINAKYDAELAALEQAPASIASVSTVAKANVAKAPSFQLDLTSIGEAVANQLKESIVNQGLGATFNIQESVDSKIAENINKGKQNSCK